MTRWLCVGALAVGGMMLPIAHSEVVRPDDPKTVEGLTGNTAARASLIAETRGVTPGGTQMLALAFDVAPHWHVYWNGINDTGGQPTITLELPDGWRAGSVQWPAPVRHVAPGDIVDHVLEGQVTLIIPVSVPATASVTAEGAPLIIKGKAGWLVCSEACMIGSAELSVPVAVVQSSGEASKPSADAPRFAAARARHPVQLPGDGSVVIEPRAGSVAFSAVGATGLKYYPQAESRRPTDLVSGVTTESDMLTVAFETGEAEVGVRGVLEVTRRTGGASAAVVPPVGVSTPGSKDAEGSTGSDAKVAATKPLTSWYTINLPASKPHPIAPKVEGK